MSPNAARVVEEDVLRCNGPNWRIRVEMIMQYAYSMLTDAKRTSSHGAIWPSPLVPLAPRRARTLEALALVVLRI